MKAPEPFDLTETPLNPGVSLIEASAGTGKTYAITALFVRLILEKGISVREILTVTYTKAATEELRDRVRQALVQAAQAFSTGKTDIKHLQVLLTRFQSESGEMAARLENAIRSFDEASIYTIHSFCQRTLQDRAFETGLLFDTELVTDLSALQQEVADDFWRNHFYAASPTLVAFALNNGVGFGEFADLLRTCSHYPGLEFLSQARGPSLDELSNRLESAYRKAQDLWLKSAAEIKPLFGSATKWGNKPYNNDEEINSYFQQLDQCLSEDITDYGSLNAFEFFCPDAMLSNRNKRSKTPPSIPVHRFFDACAEVCKAESTWVAGLKLAFVDYAKAEIPRRKADKKIQYFDDLLTRLSGTLAGAGGEALASGLQERYKAALIDEFQDTDPIQYSIFQRAFANRKTYLFLIGDPKQAIYGFRGADIFTYLEASGQATNHYTLGINWRSESGLVNAVNKIFDCKQDAHSFVFDRIGFQEATPSDKADREPLTIDGDRKPPFQVWFCPRAGEKDISKDSALKTLPAVVAGEIVSLLNGDTKVGNRPLKPEDIAVLVPSNRQAAKVQEALNVLKVPSVLHTTANVFDSREAAELYRVLSGIATPGEERLVKSALATDLLGWNGGELTDCSETRWHETLQTFHDYRELWNRAGFYRMFRLWLQRQQVRQRLLGFPDGDRRLTNTLHLGEALHQAENERRLGLSGLLKWLAEQIGQCHTESESGGSEEHQLRLERDDNAVKIVTVHKSKGLEYPVTFYLFPWKDSKITRDKKEIVLFHDPAQDHQLKYDLGPDIADGHRQLALKEALAENVRLCYVALTRASHRCYFTWGAINGSGTSAPSWLLHRPLEIAEPLIEELQTHFKSLSDADLKNDLNALKQAAGGNIAIDNLPEASPAVYEPEESPVNELKCRNHTASIRNDWVISSFSFFKAGLHEEQPDRDSVAPPRKEAASGKGISQFPGGSKAGTCLHEILEKLSFQSNEAEMLKLVDQRLVAHGLNGEGRSEAVQQMLKALLQFPLATGHSDFTLSNIAATDRLTELEFYFPIQNVSPARLEDFFRNFGWSADVPAQLERMAFDPVQGFLKGFIDLVFRFEDRYYLIDWKSNWLGNHTEDYTPEAVKEEMQKQSYFIQYHLYVVALHKYLALRVPDYSYDRHFGGSIYLFLRGLDSSHPERSVYRDKPSFEMIQKLSTLLEGQ